MGAPLLAEVARSGDFDFGFTGSLIYALSAFALRFSRVLGILSGLREIGVRIFQNRILIAVTELLLKSNIALSFMILGFLRAFPRILVNCGV